GSEAVPAERRRDPNHAGNARAAVEGSGWPAAPIQRLRHDHTGGTAKPVDDGAQGIAADGFGQQHRWLAVLAQTNARPARRNGGASHKHFIKWGAPPGSPDVAIIKKRAVLL